MKKVGIFGTSGMARETGDIAWELGYQPVYIARDKTELESWTGADDAMLESEATRYRDMGFAIGIGENTVRAKVAECFAQELHFTNLIHPSATFGRHQREALDRQHGLIVCAGVRFTNNIKVGNFGIFNQNATIAHDVVVEDFVHVAPGAIVSGNVQLSAGCWVGAGAVINQGSNRERLHIGADTMIGSGAVVVRDCEPGSVYAGVPARKIA